MEEWQYLTGTSISIVPVLLTFWTLTAEIIIAEFIHPELQGMYGHHGTRWVRLEELSDFCSREGSEPARKEIVLAEGVTEFLPNNGEENDSNRNRHRRSIPKQ
ncbi:hypothetical protein ACHAXM_004590 [Skeletonema potamos]|jgi:hypothetical protein